MSRLVIAVGASFLLLITGAISGGASPAPPRTAPPVASVVAQTAPAPDLPADPIDAAVELARRIYESDEGEAAGATIELLRRSGIPVVAFDGPVIATPDHLGLVDAAVYAELVPGLMQSTRRGDFYTPAQVTDLMAGFGMGLGNRPLPPELLLAALARWGKAPEDPVESRVAAAAVRALSGVRGEVLFQHADLDAVGFSPLQTVILLAHLLSNERTRSTTSWSPPPRLPFSAQRVYAQTDPCAELADAWNPKGSAGEVVSTEVLKKVLVDTIDLILSENLSPESSEWRGSLSKVRANYKLTIKALNVAVLLYGSHIQLDARPAALHFHHTDHGQAHSNLEATAWFDAGKLNINPQYIKCYELAGLQIPPPNTPLRDFRVRWRIDEGRKGMVLGGGHVLMTEGRFLRPVSRDARKLDACGTCGDPTGQAGKSRLEVYTATEDHPGEGALMEAGATVVASLDKDDFPFKITDLLSLPTKEGAPYAAAIRKSIELALSAIKRAGLPNAVVRLPIKYHGADIYVIPPSTRMVDVLLLKIPITVQAWSCTGLAGPWQGQGGFEIEESALSDLFDAAQNKVFGTSWVKPSIGTKSFQDFEFTVQGGDNDTVVDIHKQAQLSGVVRIDKHPHDGDHFNGQVGEFEVLWGGSQFSALAEDGYQIAGGDFILPIVGVDELNVCPGGGSHFGNE